MYKRQVLAFFRFLLNPEDSIALETALRLLWSCPDDLLLTAQKLCQKGLDSPDLQKEIKSYGHLEAWLERVLEWQPLMKKEKPWKLVARWEETYGSSQSLEPVSYTHLAACQSVLLAHPSYSCYSFYF